MHNKTKNGTFEKILRPFHILILTHKTQYFFNYVVQKKYFFNYINISTSKLESYL